MDIEKLNNVREKFKVLKEEFTELCNKCINEILSMRKNNDADTVVKVKLEYCEFLSRVKYIHFSFLEETLNFQKVFDLKRNKVSYASIDVFSDLYGFEIIKDEEVNKRLQSLGI